MLERQTEDGISSLRVALRTMLPVVRALICEARAPVQAPRIQTLNPVRAVLNRVAADGAAFEAPANLGLGFDKEEVVVTVFVNRASSDDAGDSGTEDEDAGLGVVRGGVR